MIYTFYSFKGGVGRSMALASVAYLLARRGLRVLVIDFDLEAPGLERYFFDEDEARRVRQQPGLIDLLQDYKRALTNEDAFKQADFRQWHHYIQDAVPSVPEGGRVDLMSAGRREPAERFNDYALAVRSFDWQDFFHQWKGERFFDWLRQEFTRTGEGARGYDLVLVDSRTGITEMGGVCAYQLADAAVMLCAANEQNIEGTLRVATDFRSPGTLALRQGREMQILVIPARLEASNVRREEFLEKFEATFARSEFLPPQLFQRGLDYEHLTLPYDPAFAVIERLVGDGEHTPTSQSTQQVFGRLAEALVWMADRPGKLRDLQQADTRSTLIEPVADASAPALANDFVLLDDTRADRDWLLRLLAGLREEGLRVVAQEDGLEVGQDWREAIGALLRTSEGVVRLLPPFRAERESVPNLVRELRGKQRVEIELNRQADAHGVEPVVEATNTARGVDGRFAGSDAAALARYIAQLWRREAAARPARLASASLSAETTPDLTEPYPGPRPFTESEARFFFGREAEAESHAPLVAANGLTLLTGAAGVGKTSYVRAELLPLLRRPGALRGAPPVHRLRWWSGDEVLQAAPNADVDFWVVDDLDNAAGVADEARMCARIDAVARLISHRPAAIRLLVILRGAWSAELAQHASDAWHLQDGSLTRVQLRLGPLADSALSQAIERPPGRLGHVAEPGLAPLLLGQIGARDGAVAQLAALLPTLWARRRRGWLTATAWPQPRQAADEALASRWQASVAASPEVHDAIQALVRSLSTVDSAFRWTGWALPWSWLRTLPDWAALKHPEALRDHLVAARVLDLWRELPTDQPLSGLLGRSTLDQGELMLALALDRADLADRWSTSPFDRRFLVWRSEFLIRVRAWERSGQSDGAALSAEALSEAQGFATDHADLITAPERALIARSAEIDEQREAERIAALQALKESEALREAHAREAAAREEAERSLLAAQASEQSAQLARVQAEAAQANAEDHAEQARQAQRRAEHQRRLTLVAVLLVLVVLAIAVFKWVESDRNRDAILAARDTGAAYLAMSLIDKNPTTAALTMREVLQAGRVSSTTAGLRFGLMDRILTKATLQGHTEKVNHSAFSPDGQTLVTASQDNTARLWSREGKPLATLHGHTEEVHHAAFSPDGQTLVTASQDKTARLWTREGKPLATLQGHTEGVHHAAFSPDGQTLVTASWDKTARLWTREGKPLATLQGHTEPVYHAAFSPDAQALVTASGDGTARVWTRAGKLLATLQGHTKGIYHAAFSPDGQILVTASRDKTARLWTRAGKPLATLQGHTEPVYHAAFSPDGQILVTASWDKTARLWTRDGKPLATLQGHTERINHAAFSPDGQTLVTASGDKTARLWTRDGKPLATLQGHTEGVNHAAFSPDGQTLVTAAGDLLSFSDNTARLWTREGKPLATLQEHTKAVYHAAFSSDGQTLVTASWDKTARLWTREGKPLGTLQGHTEEIHHAAFSPDGQTLVTASGDKTARLWTREGKPLATLQGHTASVYHAAFSPDGQKLVTASGDKTARLWTREGKLLATLQGHMEGVNHAAFSPDGQILVTASGDKVARLWTREGKPLATLQGHMEGIYHAAFSPDGQILVTASGDETARMWTREGKPLATLQGHTASVYHAAFSPDGQALVTASRDKTARLWTREGKPLAVLQGHTEPVYHAAFSPDGQMLVTASRDKTARLWTREGKPLATLQGYTKGVNHAAFSPDGQTLVTAAGDFVNSSDNTALLWPLTSAGFIQRVNQIAKPCLTTAERRTTFPDEPEADRQAAVQRCEAAAATARR